jgi:hypothetical protein
MAQQGLDDATEQELAELRAMMSRLNDGEFISSDEFVNCLCRLIEARIDARSATNEKS